jgi:hypothetical protein
MKTQPVAIDRPVQPEELKAQRRRAALRSDALYIVGAVLVAAGLGEVRFFLAPIALGLSCLIFPVLELATGFIRGLRLLPRR